MFDWYRKHPVETACWAIGGAFLGVVLAVMVAAMLGHVTVTYG